MAGSSDLPLVTSAPIHEDMKYLYASNANVSNFVSVKLYGDHNYHIWKTQMLCLMKSHNMVGLVDDRINGPRTLSKEITDQYENLLKGWIFGSINENLLIHVIDLELAKEVWEKLRFIHDPTTSYQIAQKVEEKTDVEETDTVSTKKVPNDIDMVSAKTETKDKDAISIEIDIEEIDEVSVEPKTEVKDSVLVKEMLEGKDIIPTLTIDKDKISTETEIKGEDTNTKGKSKIIRNKELRKAIVETWCDVKDILKKDKDAITEPINSDGNTVLHIAVGVRRNCLVQEILSLLEGDQLPKMTNMDGSTALHIAAIVGNTQATKLLIEKNKTLLDCSDHKAQTPLEKAYENMHSDTIQYLLKAMTNDGESKKKSYPLEDSLSPNVKIGINLLVNAISAKQYDLATELVNNFPQYVVESDNIMMAVAKTFPSGLDSGEKFIYPVMDDVCERIVERTKELFEPLWKFVYIMTYLFYKFLCCKSKRQMIWAISLMALYVFLVPIVVLMWIYSLIRLVILVVYFPLFMFYFLLWKVATRVVAPIKHIEQKKTEWEAAIKVLKLVCDEIDKLEFANAHPRYYTRPILEAARQNAYEVVGEILMRFPEAIRYKDKSGYDIIQLAIIHRSEKIFNLINIIGERKSVYRTIEDSYGNNLLHLAGRLAPSHKLKRRSGAALQLQREIQWTKEVKKLVFPAYITKENIFMETPDMVFTKEHENLVKEGEKWMKAVAESCSITAALITTIVFAAAITVPGGSNQETGIPLFTKDIAFTIFALSDAISLFASSTALLMFLSILTARFAEEDFLVSLPRRLIIGLCTLMLSTTAMMVAFGATLFLVFCHRKPWMLAPICVLAFLPIASFGTLQIPLIVDLFRSTYGEAFGKPSDNDNNNDKNKNKIISNIDIRLFFGK